MNIFKYFTLYINNKTFSRFCQSYHLVVNVSHLYDKYLLKYPGNHFTMC